MKPLDSISAFVITSVIMYATGHAIAGTVALFLAVIVLLFVVMMRSSRPPQ